MACCKVWTPPVKQDAYIVTVAHATLGANTTHENCNGVIVRKEMYCSKEATRLFVPGKQSAEQSSLLKIDLNCLPNSFEGLEAMK